MNSLFLMHLSDLHLRRSSDPLLKQCDAIVASLSTYLPRKSNLIVLVTGDIAYAGLSDEYKLAENFFARLREQLIQRYELNTFIWHFVPGNHDVDLSQSSAERSHLLDTSAPLAPGFKAILLAPQSPFAAFDKSMTQLNTPALSRTDDPFSSRLRYSVDGLLIDIALINSAIATTKPEKPGTLFIAPPTSECEKPDPDVALVAMHHPPHWLTPSHRRELLEYCDRSADLLLTGHEHQETLWVKDNDSGRLVLIEAGALQPPGDETAEFALVELDLLAKTASARQFYLSNSNVFVSRMDVQRYSFMRSTKKLRHFFAFTPKYQHEVLDALEGPLSHPHKRELVLGDIFQMPDLREEENFDRSILDSVVSHQHIVPRILARKKCLVVGADRSGKTCFSKQLQIALWSQGVVAVRLTGTQIAGASLESVRTSVLEAAEIQFGAGAGVRFLQYDKLQKAIVLDDFHLFKKGMKERDLLAGVLGEFGEVVVAVSNSSSELDPLQLAASDSPCISSFARMTILPFGPLLRDAMVRKWITLGRPISDDDETIEKDVLTTRNAVEEIVDNDLVVPYPFEIIAILQSRSSSSPDNSVGSLGKAYEAMITASLLQNGVPAAQLNTWHSYLAHLAFHLYSNDIASMTSVQFSRWHLEYEKKFLIRLDERLYLRILREAALLLQEDDAIAFRFRYVYCFFVAKYLASKITDATVFKVVERLFEHVEHDDSAKVLAFLCFSSSDERITSSLQTLADSLFASTEKLSLESESIKYINECGLHVQLTLSTGATAKENRRTQLEKADAASVKTRQQQIAAPAPVALQRPSVAGATRDFFAEYRAAGRLIGIIGQALRSHAGSLEGMPKKQLAMSSFALALRAENARLSYARHDYDIFVSRLMLSVANRKKMLSENEVELFARGIVYYFCVRGTRGALAHVARSVSSQELAVTLDDLAKESNGLVGEMMNISIRLEMGGAVPVEAIERLSKQLSDNKYATDVLRHLVARHLYLFSVKQSTRQRLCALLRLDMPQSHMLDSRVKQR